MVTTALQDSTSGTLENDPPSEIYSNAQVRNRRRVFSISLAFTLFVLVVTAPAFFYSGDNFVTRAETVNLLTTGELGIAASRKAELGDFVSQRGQYFFENEARQKLFPKYGVAYTLLYVPPLLLEKGLAGQLELIHNRGTLVMLLNLYNLVFATIIFTYLWRLASLYTRRVWPTVVFVLASIFGTFLWFYLRAHAHDIFQIAGFVAFAYHTLVFLRLGREPEDESSRHRWIHLLAATCCVGLLVHMRFSYALLYAPLCGFACAAGSRTERVGVRVQRNLSRSGWKLLWTLAVPTAIGMGLLLFAQWWKFGSMFDHGYTQWARITEDPVFTWPLESVVKTLSVYFVQPGNGNVFLHFPLIVFASLGWIAWWRNYRAEAAFSICVSTCILIPVLNWTMEGHGYGPRYLLPGLIICSVPLVLAYESLRRWRLPVRIAVVGTLMFALAWSARMQVSMNSLPFFAYFHVADLFLLEVEGSSAEEPLRKYFRPPHRGMIARDLLAYRREGQEFPPLQILLQHSSKHGHKEIQTRLDQSLQRATATNYLFLRGGTPPTQR